MTRVLAGGLFLAGVVAAHYTWIAPAPAPLVQGKVNKVLIAHGHQFPVSEEAIVAAQVKAFAIAPGGKRTELKSVKVGKLVEAAYTPMETGTHAFGFVQDRGVTSRTPGGVKLGGRDVNKDVAQASRVVRTAVAFASTAKVTPPGKPLGLELEIVPQISASSVTLQLLRSGKPLAATAIQVLTSGSEEPKELGKTSAQGTLIYAIGAGTKSPVLFIAAVAEPAAKGASYDTTNLSTSLYLSW
jgi:uncharacterized GH25 family protein